MPRGKKKNMGKCHHAYDICTGPEHDPRLGKQICVNCGRLKPGRKKVSKPQPIPVPWNEGSTHVVQSKVELDEIVQRAQRATQRATNPSPISDYEEFQQAYGDDWIRTVQSPAFRAGMQLLNIRANNKIISLTPEEIEKNGSVILAKFQGQLQHEDDLMTLHTKQDFRLPLEEPEVYRSPEEAAAIEETIEKFRAEREKVRHHA